MFNDWMVEGAMPHIHRRITAWAKWACAQGPYWLCWCPLNKVRHWSQPGQRCYRRLPPGHLSPFDGVRHRIWSGTSSLYFVLLYYITDSGFAFTPLKVPTGCRHSSSAFPATHQSRITSALEQLCSLFHRAGNFRFCLPMVPTATIIINSQVNSQRCTAGDANKVRDKRDNEWNPTKRCEVNMTAYGRNR